MRIIATATASSSRKIRLSSEDCDIIIYKYMNLKRVDSKAQKYATAERCHSSRPL